MIEVIPTTEATFNSVDWEPRMSNWRAHQATLLMDSYHAEKDVESQKQP